MKWRNLDLRTCIVMLAIFAVGYATCLALQPPTALALGDRLEVEELVADRIIANESIQSAGTIGFTNGPELYRTGDLVLWCHGNIGVEFQLAAQSLAIGPTTIVDHVRNLQNVRIGPDVIGGTGLDVGKLGGHPASDYVLWSDLGAIKVRPPVREP